MASINKTPNLNLSQFVASDKPAWLTDYNNDMSKIDAAVGAIQTSVDDTLQTTVQQLSEQVSTVETNVETAVQQLTEQVDERIAGFTAEWVDIPYTFTNGITLYQSKTPVCKYNPLTKQVHMRFELSLSLPAQTWVRILNFDAKYAPGTTISDVARGYSIHAMQMNVSSSGDIQINAGSTAQSLAFINLTYALV